METTTPTKGTRMTIAHGHEALQEEQDQPFVTLFRHGSLEVEFYKPHQVDRQEPHTRDEIYVVASGSGYVVASGSGYFVKGAVRQPFEPGEVLFVPAGVVHRFEDFTDDFATWVFFYGPEGGEATAPSERTG